MIWNPIEDRIKENLNGVMEIIQQNFMNTKRTLLQVIAQIYDPIGFFSRFVIRAKILMQEIWTSGADWDDILPAEIQNKWNTWSAECSNLNHITIQREYFDCSPSSGVSIYSLMQVPRHMELLHIFDTLIQIP